MKPAFRFSNFPIFQTPKRYSSKSPEGKKATSQSSVRMVSGSAIFSRHAIRNPFFFSRTSLQGSPLFIRYRRRSPIVPDFFRNIRPRLRNAQCLANTGEITQSDFHERKNPANGMKFTQSPTLIVLPGGLSINPSPHTTDDRTPDP